MRRNRSTLSLLLSLTAAALVLGTARPARAHVFSTDLVRIVGFGQTGEVTVTDLSGCAAEISAVVANPEIASVDPFFVTAVMQTFTVTAGDVAGTTQINFSWTGVGPGCTEVSSHVVTVEVRDYGRGSSANNDNSGTTGDPVNTWNGELYAHEPPDLTLRGPMPLRFQRYYASYLRRSFIVGTLGDNWRHNFEWAIHNVGSVLVLVNDVGRVMRFTRMGTITDPWTQQTGKDLPYQVVQQGTTRFYVLDPRDQHVYVFDVPPGDTAIRLVQIEDPRGNTLDLDYDASGRLIAVGDGLGRALTFQYDPAGHVQLVSDGVRTVELAHTGDELTAVTDARGFVTLYEYDPAHPDPALLVRAIRPRGNSPWTQSYDDQGRVATQADAAGNLFTFGYGTGGMTTITDPSGAMEVHVHDENGSLVSAAEGGGQPLTITHDADGRRAGIALPGGRATGITWDPVGGGFASVTNTRGDTLAYSYASRVHPDAGFVFTDVSRIDYPDGTAETFTYDAGGNLLTRTDPAGNVWRMTYNARGQLLTSENPLGGVTTTTYSPSGNLASMTDPAGNTTTYTHDAFGRLTAQSHADGTSRLFSYDAQDRTLTMTTERGGTTTWSYDANGNVASVTDAAGSSWVYGYDDNDRRVTIRDRVGHVLTFAYDGWDRVIGVASGAGGSVAWEHAGAGDATAFVDAEGARWTLGNDADGALVAITDPTGRTERQRHDPDGFATEAESAGGAVTRLTTDARGRVTAVEDPTGAVTSQEFDASGQLAAMTIAGGARVAVTQNALGLVEEVVDPNQGVWRYAYDPSGRLLSQTDAAGRMTTYTYDSRNRVSRVGFAGGGTLDVTYDGAGNPTRRLYSDGVDLAYTYDVLGNLVGAPGLAVVYDDEGRVTFSNGLLATRDALGRVAALELAPGKSVTYAYDRRNRVTSVTDWLGGVTTFEYDDAGRPTAVRRPNGVDTTFAYDAEGRVTAVADGAVTALALTRDGAGRVIVNDRQVPLELALVPGEEATFGYDAASQLAGATYDGGGRLTGAGSRSYTWDLAERLTSVTDGGISVVYTYDAIGQLLTRTEAGTTRAFVWNLALDVPVVSVEREGGADAVHYVHGPDGALLYAVDAAGGRRFYHYDEAGNTLFLSDDAGAPVVAYAYDPYGAAVASVTGVDNPYTWGGRWGVMQEPALGLYRMGWRMYDSGSMRFLSREPQQPQLHPNTANPYVYAAGNPVVYDDPLGLAPDVAQVAEGLNNNVSSVGGALSVTGDTVQRVRDITGQIALTGAINVVPHNPVSVDRAVRAAQRAQTWRRVNDVAHGRGARAAGHAGTAAQVAAIGLEGYRFHGGLQALQQEYLRACRSANERAERCQAKAWADFEAKLIHRYQLQRRLSQCQYELEMSILMADEMYWADLPIQTMASFGNMLGTFVPFNPYQFQASGEGRWVNPFTGNPLFGN